VGEHLRRRRINLDRLLGHRRGQTQELARLRDRLGAIAAGEQAVVADAMEAFGQHVDEKPADELADIERHRRVPAGALDPVVLDLERDAVLVDRDQTAVRDGDAVRVARQITIVNSLNKRLIVQKKKPNSSITRLDDRKVILEQVARIDVHEDRLAIRLKPAGDEETSDAADDHLLSIPWQKPPSRKSRQILSRTASPKVKSAQRGSNVALAS
jgi:hypothetical protein